MGEVDIVDAFGERGEIRTAAEARLRTRFRERTRQEWDALLGGPETCFTPVLTMEEALDSEQMKARGLVTSIDMHGQAERQLTTAVDRLGTGTHVGAPGIGEHSDAILVELGRSPQDIQHLHQTGVV